MPPTAADPSAASSRAVDDRFPFSPLQQARRNRRFLSFVVLGLAAYLATLVATAPARLILPSATGIIWKGEADLSGGNRIAWRWAPLRSLFGLGFAVRWTVTGPATDLAGRARLRPGSVVLDDVRGTADGALLTAVAPQLPFQCALTAVVDLRHLALGGGERSVEGEIISEAGSCRANHDGVATAIPALLVSAGRIGGQPSALRLAPLGQRRRTLAIGSLGSDGRLELRITREGAAVLPFAAPTGGITITTDL